MADVEEEQKWSGKSHLEVVAEVRGAVRQLLQDPLLHDLPPDVTPEEAGSRLAVVQGRALTLQLRTYQDRIIPVVVLQGCTVRGLMQAVEREVSRDCSRRRGTAANLLSWKYVWQTYWLAHGQTRLEQDSARLASYSIGNHSELRFIKKLRREHRQAQP